MLYKYVPEARLDILEKNLIRFTSYRDLNDPFECQFTVDPISRERERARQDGYLAEWAEVQVWLRGRMGQLGMLSLSQTPDNLLMWAHYANSHTGLVLGFDSCHKWFKKGSVYYGEPGFGKTYVNLGGLQTVKYAREMPDASSSGRRRIPVKVFVTKSTDWSYEKEVRKFRHLSESSCTVGQGKVHLFEFPRDLVKEVILGCQSSSELESKVRHLKDGAYPHITLKKAEVDRRTFSLKIDGLA